MTDVVSMSIPIVTVNEIALPRWMTPFAKHLFGIPTHMTPQERLLLFQTALALPQGFTIVEIGSYLGASTAFMAFAALHRSGLVHAVDPWTNDAMGNEAERDTWGDFRRNIEPFAHYVAPHRGYSAEVRAREPDLACDMLFVDGDHSYGAVVTDLQAWLPALRPRGVLAMHDVDAPGPKQAFDDLVAPRLTEAPQVLDRLLVCRPGPPAGSAAI